MKRKFLFQVYIHGIWFIHIYYFILKTCTNTETCTHCELNNRQYTSYTEQCLKIIIVQIFRPQCVAKQRRYVEVCYDMLVTRVPIWNFYLYLLSPANKGESSYLRKVKKMQQSSDFHIALDWDGKPIACGIIFWAR